MSTEKVGRAIQLPCHEGESDRDGGHASVGQQVLIAGLLPATGQPEVDPDGRGDEEHEGQHEVVGEAEG